MEYVKFVKQWEEHLVHQQCYHRLYGAYREESKSNPSEFLCIIHEQDGYCKNRPCADAGYNKGYSRFGPTSYECNWYGFTWARGWHVRTLLSTLLARRFQFHNIIVDKVVPLTKKALNLEVWVLFEYPLQNYV